jgi:glycosyltransferase involved in cell wall biosynthesis
MAAAQTAMGHFVSVVATDHALETIPRLDGVEITSFPCTFSRWRFSLSLGRALAKLVGASDIVHIHMIWEYPTYAGARICRKLKKPYIIRPCGMLDRWSLSQGAWKKAAYLHLLGAPLIRNAAALHFTTHDELTNSLCFHDQEDSFVVPNGLPANVFVPPQDIQAFRCRFPELKEKRIVLFLGRLHYKKQPNVVLDAFKHICGIDERLALVLAGPCEPAYLNHLRQLAKTLGLNNRVVFTGVLQGAVVREALFAAEIFVLPSLQENFAIAVAEAMAAGCPVVVSEQVNLASEIRDNKAGIVCKSDAVSTAGALEILIRNDGLRAIMAKNGRSLVADRFTWRKVSADLMSVYHDILSSTRTSRAWSNRAVSHTGES